ncbi:flagellar brake protein [Leeia oryzae]|uniref:flagellar brake protein n=1 Tax=Leeia oryzae TaxID=356662 RepID=UPI00036A10D1|nr:flagellar brake protein [Leeia oryzae]
MMDTQESPTPLPSDDEFGRFTLQTQVEIVYVLRGLIKSKQPIAIYFRQGQTSMLTTLLEVNTDAGTLVFDWGGSETVNQQLLNSERNVFVTSPEGVKIQFAVGKATAIQHQGKPAFSVALPDALVKMQRREYFRLQTPIANPYWLTVRNTATGTQRLALCDISLGGIGLIVPDREQFKPFETYDSCLLDLRDAGVFDVSMQVRNLVSLKQKNDAIQHRMGCMFTGNVAALQNRLQRFIAQLERERNTLLKRE